MITPRILLLLAISGLCGCLSQSAGDEGIEQITAPEITVKTMFGLETDSFFLVRDVIKPNQFLSEILLNYGVTYSRIHELAMQSREVFDVRRLVRGRPYTLFCTRDTSRIARCFIYQPNERDFVVYDLREDSIRITLGRKPIEFVHRESEGEIRTSLYDALKSAGEHIALAFEMADVFAWTIDFYRLQKGDSYRVFYTEKMVDGQSIGIGRIDAVLFHHEGKDFYAFYYEQDSLGGDYFDEEANSLRKAFLKSPLKFSRRTSGYTLRRFHPVQKRWKAHLGTDYAAPRGTPIMSTGDGKVIEARYRVYNGNYVKIRHNSLYATQYLHMSKIRKGIRPGVYVKQGEVIGYVGSTGLATGPHVCYRFWKNGSQVNHLKEEFPPSEPVREENMAGFYNTIRPLEARLKSTGFNPTDSRNIYSMSRLYRDPPVNSSDKPSPE